MENKLIESQFRCSKCKRVSIGIEADGICGSPICRKEEVIC